MDTSSCANCATPLEPVQHFCAHCGQKSPAHRLTPGHFIHESFHALTHADKGIFYLLRSLATHPGTVAREYMAGRRKKYFNPFTFFILVMGLFVFMNTYFNKAAIHRDPDPAILQRIPTEAARQQYLVMMERSNTISEFFTKNGNIVAMFAIPLLGLLTWFFYRKRQYNFTEHLVANLLFTSFMNLVFTLTIFPLQSIYRDTGWGGILVLMGMFWQVLYMWWAFNGFLQLRTAGERFRSFLVSFTCLVAWLVVSMSFIAIYIYRSPQFYKFFTRMMG